MLKVAVLEKEHDGGQQQRMVPVKTENAIPKSKIFDCQHELKGMVLKAPVMIGDVVIKNVCGTGMNIVATRNVRAS